MMTTTRAERRARNERARNRYRKIIQTWGYLARDPDWVEHAARFYDTRQRCQMPCCNRHRLRYGMNAQELRARGLTRARRAGMKSHGSDTAIYPTD